MMTHLEDRFIRLAVAKSSYDLAYTAFSTRFAILFEHLAEDMGVTMESLGKRMGWEPIPGGGNRIMRGEADPSPEDVARLLELYLNHTPVTT